jgi:hypothetical protein
MMRLGCLVDMPDADVSGVFDCFFSFVVDIGGPTSAA